MLTLALAVLPEGQKKKMRATAQIALGNMLGGMLEVAADKIRRKELTPEDQSICAAEKLRFPGFDQNFPKVQLPEDL